MNWLVVVFLLLTTVSCKKSEEHLRLVPESAGVVLIYDVQELSQKIKLNEFTGSNVYALLEEELQKEGKKGKDAAKLFASMLETPEDFGVDLEKEVYMFFTAEEDDEAFIGYVMGIDGEKFEENLLSKIEDISDEDIDIEEEDEIHYIEIDEQAIVGWNDKMLLMLVVPDLDNDSEEESKDNIEDYMVECFERKKGESIISNDDFMTFYENRKDLSFWVDAEFLTDMVKEYGTSDLPTGLNLDDISMFQFHLAFEDEAIVFITESTFDDQDDAEDLPMRKGLNEKVLKKLPQDPYAFYGASADAEEAFDYLIETFDAQGMVAMASSEIRKTLDMSLDEALRTFGGDFAFVLHEVKTTKKERVDYDFDHETEEMVETVEIVDQLMPMMALAMSINDDKLYNKLIELLEQADPDGEMVSKEDNYYIIDVEGIDIYTTLEDDVWVITNDEALIKIVSDGDYGNKSLANSDHADDIEDSYGYGYLNLDYDSYPKALKNRMEEDMDKDDKKLFDNMISILSHATYKGTSKTSVEMKLHLKDSDENSLYTIFKTIDDNVQKMIAL